MSKTLRKAIMKWSKLRIRNTFNKNRSFENWQNYKRYRNICSNILKSTKKTFFANLNINEITDNRKFWKTVELFSLTNVRPAIILFSQKKKLSTTTKKFPTPLMSISQILPTA